jgi:hypothetical protein
MEAFNNKITIKSPSIIKKGKLISAYLPRFCRNIQPACEIDSPILSSFEKMRIKAITVTTLREKNNGKAKTEKRDKLKIEPSNTGLSIKKNRINKAEGIKSSIFVKNNFGNNVKGDIIVSIRLILLPAKYCVRMNNKVLSANSASKRYNRIRPVNKGGNMLRN